MIRFEVRGLRRARDDRPPERRNALNGELCDAAARRTSSRIADLRAVVITGAGSAFCAGADLVTRFAPTESSRRRSGRHVPARVRGAARRDRRPSGAGDRRGQRSRRSARACSSRSRATSASRARARGSRSRSAKLGVHLSPREHLAARAARRPGRGARLPARRSHRRRRRGAAARHRAAARRRRAGATRSRSPTRSPRRRRSRCRATSARSTSSPRRSGCRPTRAAEIAALEAAAFASEDLQEGMAAFAEKRTPQLQRALSSSASVPVRERALQVHVEREEHDEERHDADHPRERVPPAAERPPPEHADDRDDEAPQHRRRDAVRLTLRGRSPAAPSAAACTFLPLMRRRRLVRLVAQRSAASFALMTMRCARGVARVAARERELGVGRVGDDAVVGRLHRERLLCRRRRCTCRRASG